MRTLDNARLWLPDAVRDPAKWDEAARKTEGPEKRALVAESAIVRAFACAPLGPLSPETLGWLLLLMRTFHCVEGARALLGRNADIAAEILLRMAKEIRIHVITVREPWDAHVERRDRGEQDAGGAACWQGVRERLRAYAAWCLANDIQFLKERLNFKELRAVHCPTPPSAIPKDPMTAAIRDLVFGPLQIVSEQEATQDRVTAEKDIRHGLDRAEKWLADERFEPYRQRIDEIRAKTGFVPANFGQMFSDEQISYSRMLRAQGLRYEYGVYQRASQVLHGSTVNRFLWNVLEEHDGSETVMPRCLPTPSDAEEYCEDIFNTLSGCAFVLWTMHDHAVS